ncbi:MAG: DNA-binding response regulator [Chlorobi bacterium CHB1]|nr:DNA-binding response regulator [Chlorobi bacterium CHB1]
MKKCILLVDEDQDVLDLLKFNLEAEGYEVVTAKDGRQALAVLHNRTDLIILEEKLPEQSGGEVFQWLRSQNVAKDIPALFLTTAPLNPDIVAQRSPATF